MTASVDNIKLQLLELLRPKSSTAERYLMFVHEDP